MKKLVHPIVVLVAALTISSPILARGHEFGQGCAGQNNMSAQRGQWTEKQRQDFVQYKTERHQARLNYMAKQLNISSEQQTAWNSYASARTNMMSQMSKMAVPGKNMTAAAVLKIKSDRMAVRAKVLNEISLATAKLESVLTAEQKIRFSQMAGQHRNSAEGFARGNRQHKAPVANS